MKKVLLNLFILIILISHNSVFAANVKLNDYSKSFNWLQMPENINYPVDIFYIYPTTCLEKVRKSDFCEISNTGMRAGAKQVFELQAKAFQSVGNIYAPYYTQVNLFALSGTTYEQVELKLRYTAQSNTDIMRSLDYYFKNKNNGRPYILVSHSQGSAIMLNVLSVYMKKNPQYYKNMVAAYIIGIPVTKEYMKSNPHLKFAKKKDDIGVIISYNTVSNYRKGADIVHSKNQIVINPISWTRNSRMAKSSRNLGSLNEKTLTITTPGIANAKIDKKNGVVVCNSVPQSTYQIPWSNFFGTGSYHGQDFQFYYLNLRQNAKDRIKAYYRKNNKK